MPMNRILNAKLLIFVLLLLYFGCSKPTPPTMLKLTITDSLGNAVKGAKVSLFDNPLDYSNRANQIANSQSTGSDGIVYFSNLKPQSYFWYAQKGCSDDSFSKAGTWDAITANQTNSFTVPISGVGKLFFVNHTNNFYKIEGTNLDPNAVIWEFSQSVIPIDSIAESFPLGTFSIRIYQVGTTDPNAYDKTSIVPVTCGTTRIIIP
jgi:hypothetical protein